MIFLSIRLPTLLNKNNGTSEDRSLVNGDIVAQRTEVEAGYYAEKAEWLDSLKFVPPRALTTVSHVAARPLDRP